MASVRSALVRAQIKLIRPILRRLEIDEERKAQDALGRLGAKVLDNKVKFIPEPFPAFPAEWARPKAAVGGAVLYLHGGGYVSGGLGYAKGFGGAVAAAIRRDTLCIGYRLAPEYPFPAALDDAVEAYLRILENCPPEQVALVGESAGGGLVFALLQLLRLRGLPLPGCAVAISPWADLRCEKPSITDNADKDPGLFADVLRDCAELYAAGDVLNPLVSPVLGEFEGCPPCLIIAGSDELLRDDSVGLCHALRRDGVSAELHVAKDMWHVYCLYGIPEAKHAIRRVKVFIGRHC